jgi:Ca2+-binding EF-hand superfamily protein
MGCRRKKPWHVSTKLTSRSPTSDVVKAAEAESKEDKETEPNLVPPKVHPAVVAFSRLRTKELAKIEGRRRPKADCDDSYELCPSNIAAMNCFDQDAPQCPRGLLSADTFHYYDMVHNGELCVGELGAMLRYNGMRVDYTGASRVMELIGGPGVQSIRQEDFARCVLRLVQKRRGSGGEAAEVLRCVFRSYDADKSGLLEVPEYTQFLSDVGHAPKTKEEWEDQGFLVASCRRDGCCGPLNFQEFIILARKINAGKTVDSWPVKGAEE